MAFGDEILQMIKAAEEAEPERRTNCPLCEWPLEEKDGQLHCPFCGWTEGLQVKRKA